MNEELNKSIDSLIDELFTEEEEEEVEKSIDIAKDAPKTADEALRAVPESQKDENRGAGRPKQISDVPQKDEDGSRDGEYDGKIAQNQGEVEPEETNQSESMDQTQEKKRLGDKPKAPASRPFMKSESGEELTKEEYEEFKAFKKAKSEEVAKAEELKKAEQTKKEQELLVKSAVAQATEALRKENEELKKSFSETQALIKAMASQPRQAKSITNLEVIEKAQRPEETGAETFSKSEILDAAFELAKSGKIDASIVSEIEMTGGCTDRDARAAIEKKLAGK